MDILKLRDISFSYQKDKNILTDINLSLKKGELASLLGLSGSGKTTLLRLCAGFEKPTRGEIVLRDQLCAGPNTYVPCKERKIGFVFQDFALFSHLSVLENIHYGCTEQSHFQKAQELMDLLDLAQHTNKKPFELSGGEKQKVALARTLALEPDLIFLDEPFSSIDVQKTVGLVQELRKLFQHLQVTALMVTHSQYEAIDFSDKIFLLHQGRLEQEGVPEDLYNNPKSDFVAQFFGYSSKMGDRLVRPEQLEFCRPGGGQEGVVVACQFRFNQWFVHVKVNGEVLKVLSKTPMESGQGCNIRLV